MGPQPAGGAYQLSRKLQTLRRSIRRNAEHLQGRGSALQKLTCTASQWSEAALPEKDPVLQVAV